MRNFSGKQLQDKNFIFLRAKNMFNETIMGLQPKTTYFANEHIRRHRAGFKQGVPCLTLKRVCDMIKTYSQMNPTKCFFFLKDITSSANS